MSSMMNKPGSEPQALSVVERPYGLNDYRLTDDIIVPALPLGEAVAWVKTRAPRLRGAPLFAVLYFLTREWKLCAGWHVGARRVAPQRSTVAWGKVDAGGRFAHRVDDTGWFSATAASRVLSLVVERINQTAV